MRQLLLSVLLALLALPTTTSAGEIDLRINGVGLGTSHSRVLRQLGKPLHTERGGFNECGNDITITLHYPGLVIELLGDGKGQNFIVFSIELTSSKWSVASGISVGANAKDVQAKFGQPLEKRLESGVESWSYVNKGNDGFAGFYFRDKKLVKVVWEYTIC